MKRCPQCNRVESDTSLLYCRADGALLITDSAITDDEAQTRTLQTLNQSKTNEAIAPPTGPTTPLIEDRKKLPKQKSRSAKLALVLGVVIVVIIAVTAYFARDFAQAEKYLRDALQLNPEFALTHVFLFYSMYQQGKTEQSIPHFVMAAFNNHSKDEQAKFETEIRQAYSASGKKGMLEKARDLLKASPKRDYSHAHMLGSILIQLGEKDEAFVWLNRAADVKHAGIPTLRVDAAFDEVRSDPRLEQLMKRVGI